MTAACFLALSILLLGWLILAGEGQRTETTQAQWDAWHAELPSAARSDIAAPLITFGGGR